MSFEELSSESARVIDKQQNDPMDVNEPEVIVINSKDPSPPSMGFRQRPYKVGEEEMEEMKEEEDESKGDEMAAFYGS